MLTGYMVYPNILLSSPSVFRGFRAILTKLIYFFVSPWLHLWDVCALILEPAKEDSLQL